MSRSRFGSRLLQVFGIRTSASLARQRRSKPRPILAVECLERRALLANITASAVIGSTPDGANSDYAIALSNSGSSSAAVGTFWFAWTAVPNEDFLATRPISVTPPAGWTDSITHSGSGDGYAILFSTNNSADDVQPGSSLNFNFTSADTPASVNGDSQFYPGTPVTTSVVYPTIPFSDGGHQFVVTQSPTVTPPPPAAAPPTIVGEQVVPTTITHNSHGKPIGKPVLTFVFQFSTAMNPATVADKSNYQLDSISTKKVKKQVKTVLHALAIQSATYSASTNSVTLVTNATKTTFPKGGQLTVIGSPSGGVESAAGAFPTGNAFFTISPNARSIVP
jgi:hypothetical protein